MSENNETLKDETKSKLKALSKAVLRLHKILLEGAKADYETKNGKIVGASQYLQLVIDDSHFSWLRKMSSLIALIDEATSLRRPAAETEAQALLAEAKTLLEFRDADENFNDKFQTALQTTPDASVAHNDALNLLK